MLSIKWRFYRMEEFVIYVGISAEVWYCIRRGKPLNVRGCAGLRTCEAAHAQPSMMIIVIVRVRSLAQPCS